MKGLRYVIAVLVGIGAGAGTLYGIANTGLSGVSGLTGTLYSSLVIYPTAVLVFAFAFWIVYVATDPGTDH